MRIIASTRNTARITGLNSNDRYMQEEGKPVGIPRYRVKSSFVRRTLQRSVKYRSPSAEENSRISLRVIQVKRA